MTGDIRVENTYQVILVTYLHSSGTVKEILMKYLVHRYFGSYFVCAVFTEMIVLAFTGHMPTILIYSGRGEIPSLETNKHFYPKAISCNPRNSNTMLK